MPSSYEILSAAAQKQGVTVEGHQGLAWMMLTKGTRKAEVWFTETRKISRADVFEVDRYGYRDRVQGRHMRRQILRWLRGA